MRSWGVQELDERLAQAHPHRHWHRRGRVSRSQDRFQSIRPLLFSARRTGRSVEPGALYMTRDINIDCRPTKLSRSCLPSPGKYGAAANSMPPSDPQNLGAGREGLLGVDPKTGASLQSACAEDVVNARRYWESLTHSTFPAIFSIVPPSRGAGAWRDVEAIAGPGRPVNSANTSDAYVAAAAHGRARALSEAGTDRSHPLELSSIDENTAKPWAGALLRVPSPMPRQRLRSCPRRQSRCNRRVSGSDSRPGTSHRPGMSLRRDR
jgi:hypothetical protein